MYRDSDDSDSSEYSFKGSHVAEMIRELNGYPKRRGLSDNKSKRNVDFRSHLNVRRERDRSPNSREGSRNRREHEKNSRKRQREHDQTKNKKRCPEGEWSRTVSFSDKKDNSRDEEKKIKAKSRDEEKKIKAKSRQEEKKIKAKSHDEEKKVRAEPIREEKLEKKIMKSAKQSSPFPALNYNTADLINAVINNNKNYLSKMQACSKDTTSPMNTVSNINSVEDVAVNEGNMNKKRNSAAMLTFPSLEMAQTSNLNINSKRNPIKINLLDVLKMNQNNMIVNQISAVSIASNQEMAQTSTFTNSQSTLSNPAGNTTASQSDMTLNQSSAMSVSPNLKLTQTSDLSVKPYTFASGIGNNSQHATVASQKSNLSLPEEEIIKLRKSVLYPPNPIAPPPTKSEKPLGCKTVFVSGLPEKTTKEIIVEIFERCGTIEICTDIKKLANISMSASAAYKYFCHIRFVDELSVEKAIKLSGYKLKIKNKDEAAYCAIFNVDYAQANNDKRDYEVMKNVYRIAGLIPKEGIDIKKQANLLDSTKMSQNSMAINPGSSASVSSNLEMEQTPNLNINPVNTPWTFNPFGGVKTSQSNVTANCSSPMLKTSYLEMEQPSNSSINPVSIPWKINPLDSMKISQNSMANNRSSAVSVPSNLKMEQTTNSNINPVNIPWTFNSFDGVKTNQNNVAANCSSPMRNYLETEQPSNTNINPLNIPWEVSHSSAMSTSSNIKMEQTSNLNVNPISSPWINNQLDDMKMDQDSMTVNQQSSAVPGLSDQKIIETSDSDHDKRNQWDISIDAITKTESNDYDYNITTDQKSSTILMSPTLEFEVSEDSNSSVDSYALKTEMEDCPQYRTITPREINFASPTKDAIIEFKKSVLYPPDPETSDPITRAKPPDCKTVFVGVLPEKATEDIVKEIFETCGTIKSIKMSKKYYCHIQFCDEVSVDNATYFSGYTLKIDNRDDTPYSAALYVHYSQAKDDAEDIVSKQKALKKQSEHFYSMIRSTQNMVKKLQFDKIKYVEQLEEAKNLFKKQIDGNIKKFVEIEKIFNVGRTCWDNFSRKQRKNLRKWKAQTRELKNAHLEKLITEGMHEDSKLSADEKAARKKEEEAHNLKKYEMYKKKFIEKTDSLRQKLKAARQKIKTMESEEEESEKKLSAIRATLQNSIKVLLEMNEKHAKAEAELKELREFKSRIESEQTEKTSSSHDGDDTGVSSSINLDNDINLKNDARIINQISSFLISQPFGATVEIIWHFLHRTDLSITISNVESVMKRCPMLFKEESSGTEANSEKKWKFIGFQTFYKSFE